MPPRPPSHPRVGQGGSEAVGVGPEPRLAVARGGWPTNGLVSRLAEAWRGAPSPQVVSSRRQLRKHFARRVAGRSGGERVVHRRTGPVRWTDVRWAGWRWRLALCKRPARVGRRRSSARVHGSAAVAPPAGTASSAVKILGGQTGGLMSASAFLPRARSARLLSRRRVARVQLADHRVN
jgi:hypothetical protein